jgi:signal transduction histidine kinase
MFYPGKKAKLRAHENDITISYTSVDLTNGPEIKYAYKLIGEDTGWSMAGGQRQINFSHLAPGNYTFMVRAANSSGLWNNQPASISFSIRPPFTQTAWFYGLAVLAIAGVFYGLHRFRLRQLLRTEQIRSEISKNLHDEVGSALTNISLGSLLAQKQLTKEGPVNHILERIYQDSQEASASMREIVWSINPKIDTIGEAFPRMVHYASELLEAKNIELWVEMPSAIEQVRLSMQQRRDIYLVFKEAVNNLAKYSNATKATIKFQLPGNTLVMIISDNGTGFDTTVSYNSNGLRNMRERAQTHQWQLLIESGTGAGTTITLRAQIA